MRRPAVLCLAVILATFGRATSLECYSCSAESSNNCVVKQQCSGGGDSCLQLSSNGVIYAGCIRYSDCDFATLGSRYTLPEFTFSCCQSDLCNKKKKSWFQKLFG